VDGNFDELARAGANALVTAMANDSWRAVKSRLAFLIGQEQRMNAARDDLIAARGPDRHQIMQAQVQSWSTRLRDAMEDDPSLAQALRDLLADLRTAPQAPGWAPLHTHARDMSHVGIIGGPINRVGGDVNVGGSVVKRNTKLTLNPLVLVAGIAKMAAAHPVFTMLIVVVLGTAGGVVGLRTHSPGASSTAGGAAPAPGLTQAFGDSYARWQLQVGAYGEAAFSNRLLLVSSQGAFPGLVTAYQEATGAKVWSTTLPDQPVATGGFLLVPSYSTFQASYISGAASRACPSAISRINPATGRTMWTSSLAAASICSPPTASDTYVVCDRTILDAATGATLQQLSATSQGWAFGNDILVQDGSLLELDTLQAGHLQASWQRSIVGYTTAPEPPQIALIRQSADGDSPARLELLDSGSGATVKSATAKEWALTPDGLDVISTSGRLLFLSASGVKAGPVSSGFSSFGNGILWDYRSPNGYSTGPVYAYALNSDSFKTLGRLIATRSQVAAGGNDSYVISDGRYAAIVAAPEIYIFKL
jgi:hypothetical protein